MHSYARYVFLVLLILSAPAFALDRTWMGVTTDFHTPSNWNPSGVPGSGERAIISENSVTPVITSNITVGEIVVSGGLTNSGTLTVNGANVTVEQGVIINGSPSTIAQITITNSGTVTAATLNINPDGGGHCDLTVNTSCIFTVTNACNAQGSVSHSPRILGGGTFNINAGATMTSGGSGAGQPTVLGVALTNVAGTLVAAQSEINIGGGSTVTVSVSGTINASSSAIFVQNTSTLRMAANGQMISTQAFDFQDGCTLEINHTQTGEFKISSFASVSTPAILTGSANPIFGATATVTMASSNASGGYWALTSGLVVAGTLMLDTQNLNNNVFLVIPTSGNLQISGVLTLNGDTSDQSFITPAGAPTGSALIVQPGGLVSVSGNCSINTLITNNSMVEVQSGQSTFGQGYTQSASGSIFNLHNGAQLTFGGNVSISDGELIVNGSLSASTLMLTGGAQLEGTGTVTAPTTNAALIRPGGGGVAGTLTVNGTYTQTPSLGKIEIEFASASLFDKLVVMGNASLSNEIEFKLLAGYTPTDNLLFTNALEAQSGSVSGTFSVLSQDSGSPAVTFTAEYAASNVSLRAAVRNPPTVTSVTASRTIAPLGAQIAFTATATDPGGFPLTFSWNFKDGSTDAGNPVTHAFSQPGTYLVEATASNGGSTGAGTVSVEILGPNSGGGGETNVGQGKPAVMNPLNGIALSVQSSNGGVVELAIDVDALNRDDFDLLTAFDLIQGRKSARPGPNPTDKFTEPAIAVATTTATDTGTITERGKARRQIAVSSREVGQAVPFTNPPADRSVKLDSMKGKFLFSDTKPDQFTFTGRIELPEGLDLSQPRKLELGIGNILDSVEFDVKGKTKQVGALNRIVKAQVKYPKVPKDNPVTKAGQEARLTITMKGVNFSDQGFDTEGIAATLRSDEEGLKSVPRSIQASILFAGATFEGAIPVQFKLTKNADSGTITGRSSAK